ncbi:hypothetical protein AgCh_006711 [Apium graveolens]
MFRVWGGLGGKISSYRWEHSLISTIDPGRTHSPRGEPGNQFPKLFSLQELALRECAASLGFVSSSVESQLAELALDSLRFLAFLFEKVKESSSSLSSSSFFMISCRGEQKKEGHLSGNSALKFSFHPILAADLRHKQKEPSVLEGGGNAFRSPRFKNCLLPETAS